jgi:IS4 transposase
MGPQSQQFCEHLRVITVDYKTRDGESIEIVTNDLKSSAAQIADLYKQRWQIEVFFKWIKQHLKIKRFLGFNSNAVWIQIWTAMIAYLLIWKYYHEQRIAQKDKITIFQFLTRVQMILFIPDDTIRFSKKPKPPNLTALLFEKS